MAWVTLAQGASVEEFQASKPPVSELSSGTRMQLIIDTPWWAPIAPLADLFGAEWVAQRLLNEADTVITDVEGQGWHRIVVHMKVASPGWPAVIIGVIAVLLFTAGLAYIVHQIRLVAEIAGPAGISLFLLIAIGIGIYIVTRRPAKKPAKEPEKEAKAEMEVTA